MNNKHLISALIVSLFTVSSFAQLKDFNLSDYKLPNLKRSALDLNFDFTNSNDLFFKTENGTKNQHEITGNLNANYNFYINTAKTQRLITGNFTFNPKYSTYSTNYNPKSSTINPLINYTFENRYYYKTNTFIETDLIFGSHYYYNYFEVSNGSKTTIKSNSFGFSLSIPVKYGFGRIENVTDARHAVYILEELLSNNRLNTVSTENILEFSSLISKLKNMRFFDSRHRKIYEIEALDSFLTTKKMISKSDARYFTTLNDLWDFGGTQSRSSGERISFGLTPGTSLIKTNSSYSDTSYTDIDNTIKSYSITGKIEYYREKPISLKWQKSTNVSLYGKYYYLNDDNYLPNSQIPSIGLFFTQSLSYYPNTRTTLSFNYGGKYIQHLSNKLNQSDFKGSKTKGALVFTEFNTTYYFSPKLRLNANANLSYRWIDNNFDSNIRFIDADINSLNNINNLNYNKNLNLNIRASITYSLF